MTFLEVLALLVMVVGLVGALVPIVPGLVLTWLAGVASLLYGGTDGFTWGVVAALTVLFVLAWAVTLWLPARTGRQGEVPASSLGAALVGALVGMVVIPVIGFVIGGVGGLFAAELRRGGEAGVAWRSTLQVLRAYGIGVLIEVLIGVVMIGTWLATVLIR